MSTRIPASLCAALLAASGTLGAQPVQKAQPTTTTFQVLSTVATPQENPQVQAVLARLRTKFTADATFTSRLDAALTRRDFAGAESLVAAATQVQGVQVVVADLARTGARIEHRGDRAGLVRFASYEPSAAWRFNPWYMIIVFKGKAYCVGLGATGKQECHDALIKAGYTPQT